MNFILLNKLGSIILLLTNVLQSLNHNATSSYIPYDKTMLQNLNLTIFHFLFQTQKEVVATNEL